MNSVKVLRVQSALHRASRCSSE